MKQLVEEYGMSVIAVAGVLLCLSMFKEPIFSGQGAFAQWILHWCASAC